MIKFSRALGCQLRQRQAPPKGKHTNRPKLDVSPSRLLATQCKASPARPVREAQQLPASQEAPAPHNLPLVYRCALLLLTFAARRLRQHQT